MGEISVEAMNDLKALEQLRSTIRERGLKATHSRVEVLELLRRDGRALAFKEVADLLKGKAMDPSTVFRALKDLTKVELLVSHQNEQGTDFYAAPQ